MKVKYKFNKETQAYEEERVVKPKKKIPMNKNKVIGFRIAESTQNKGCMILIAKTADGREWVCSGDHWSPTYLQPIETAFDNKTLTNK